MANASEATVIFFSHTRHGLQLSSVTISSRKRCASILRFWVGNALPNEVPKSPSAPET